MGAKSIKQSKRMDWFVWVGADAVQAAAWCEGRWLDEGRVSEAWVADAIDPINVNDALGRVAARLAPLTGLVSQGAPAHPRARLWVAVADVHLRGATLPWTPLLMRDALLPSLAQAQLVQAGHEPGARDRIRVGEGAAGQPRALVAHPQALVAACEGLAATLGASLASMLPLSALAWQQARRQGVAPVGVLADGLALLLEAGKPGGRHLVRVSAWRHADAQAELRLRWRRWRLRAQVAGGSAAEAGVGPAPAPDAQAAAPPQALPVLDWRTRPAVKGAAPSDADAELSWLAASPSASATPDAIPPVLRQLQAASRGAPSSLDAVERQAEPTPLRWAALAAAALLLVGLIADNASTWQDRRVALASTQPEPDLGRLAAATAPVDPAWSREELARIQQVNEAVRRLNVPLERLLIALQPPPDIPVALLSVDIRAAASGGRSLSQIRAQASVGQDMSRYVAHVGSRAPFVDAHLKQHERREGEPGQPYQFTMEAAWPQ